MSTIKGQGTVIKALATKAAARNKQRFLTYINEKGNLQQLSESLTNGVLIDTQVVSFSSSYDFGEQTLSVLSFVKYVGTPIAWTVYSDGTHTTQQITLIESCFPFLKVIEIEFNDFYIQQHIKPILLPYKDDFINYANSFPLGKKLFLYLNFPIHNSTFFLDSDVLFYAKSSCLSDLIKEDVNGWFLPDAEWGNLDQRYVEKTAPQHYQVNSGLFLVNKEINEFTEALSFFQQLKQQYHYFSEQSVIHILLLSNNFMPFDPRIFVLNSGDQFDFSYMYEKDAIASRHYTGPVRHKMWQRDWKWHLSLA
jgi:hypothetical protein